MKELSIREKARRYDKALERARKLNSGEGVKSPSGWTVCEVIFPELKESEDERIRKSLIDMLKNDEKCYLKEIAWLEKQGEQKLAWSEEDENAVSVLRHIIKQSEKIDSNIYTKPVKEKLFDWLKSLRTKNTWKPSDEQMNLLEELVEDNSQRYFYTILKSLYEQLKKLKGD